MRRHLRDPRLPLCRAWPALSGTGPTYVFLMMEALIDAGVHAFKIEGRQRSKSYVRGVVSAFRQAVDDIRAGREANIADLVALTEGQKQTQGAFETKKWR